MGVGVITSAKASAGSGVVIAYVYVIYDKSSERGASRGESIGNWESCRDS